MDGEHSDEEEDQQNLIHQNDTKSPIRRYSFSVDYLRPRFASTLSLSKFSLNKGYLIAICVTLLFVVIFFSRNVRGFFSSGDIFSVKIDPLSLRMRESELRALYLLKQQQLGLAALWDQTLDNYTYNPDNSTSIHFNSTSPDSNSSSPSSTKGLNSSFPPLLFEYLKNALLKQMYLSKEIQKTLLSSHGRHNLSNLDFLDVPTTYGLDGCRKVDQGFSERRTIDWKPKPNKFLFAICVSGQMSNHLICLEKHMFFAALLNRVLVIPSPKVDYLYSRIIDFHHINECFGRKVVVTFEEFSEMRKNHIHIDILKCYVSLPLTCFMDEEHVKKLKSAGISMGKLEPVWKEDIRKPSKRVVNDIKSKFASNDDVIAIGDVFYADVEQDWVTQPGGPLGHKCRTLIEPNHLIMLTAQRFIQTFLGNNFIALHFRRHGFLKFCNAKNPSCFFPIPQAAECVTRVVERANTPVIYLSTDAAESETTLLQSLILMNGKIVPLVQRPPRNSAEKWDALLYRHGLQHDPQVEAMLDKTICALSRVFIGSSGSTFTDDILRLRKDWGIASLCDEFLCEGTQPNFIAQNE